MRELLFVLALGATVAVPVAALAQDGGEDGGEDRGEDGGEDAGEPAEELEAPEPDVPQPGVPEPDVPEPEVPAPDVLAPKQALSLHLLGLFSGGLAIQYERFPEATRDWSFAVSLGSRLPSSGDYASVSVGVGGEVRWWAFNFEEGPWDERVDGGFFLGGRLDVGWYHVWDTVNGGAVGDTLALTPSVLVGWRFDIARVVEITPTLGLGVRSEIDPSGTLAAYSRGTLTMGLTVGWMR